MRLPPSPAVGRSLVRHRKELNAEESSGFPARWPRWVPRCLIAAAFAGPASSKANKPFSLGTEEGRDDERQHVGHRRRLHRPDARLRDRSPGRSWTRRASSSSTTPTSPTRSGASSRRTARAGFPTVSKDGKTYTFTVRPGMKSNTGQTLTAANFAFAINRVLNPKMQSPAVPFIVNGIVGAAGRRRRQGHAPPAASTAAGQQADDQAARRPTARSCRSSR